MLFSYGGTAIQMFHPCRKTAPIRVIHLNHAAIWNAIEVIIVAVDETNILRQRFRLPDAPSADARLRDVFEDLYAFLLDGLAVIVRKFKQIPVPGSRNEVPAIGRQVLFRDLPAFQRLTSYLVVGGKADACTVFPEVEIEKPISNNRKIINTIAVLFLGIALGTFSKFLDFRQAELPSGLMAIDSRPHERKAGL